MLTYLADFLPRVRSGFEALGLPAPWNDAIVWDHDSDLGDVLFNAFLPGVARAARARPADDGNRTITRSDPAQLPTVQVAA